MDVLLQIVQTVNSWLWDYLLIILLCGTGVYFTFRLRFIQIRKFGMAMKKVFGGFSLRGARAERRRDDVVPVAGHGHCGPGRDG